MSPIIMQNRGIEALLIGLLLVLLTPVAQADTEQPRVKLGPWAGPLNVGPGMNAPGRNLRGSEFVRQDLTGAVFEGSDLCGVHFWQCDLSKASFKGTDLSKAFIDECTLEGADFTDAIVNDAFLLKAFPDTYLSEEQLRSTRSYKTRNLSKCVIPGLGGPDDPDVPPRYDFRNAKLEGAVLAYGDFTQCDFTDASIDGIKAHCKMAFAQLASTKTFKTGRLRGMDLSLSFVGRSDFSGIDLTGTHLAIGRAPDAIFKDAVINGCQLGGRTREQLYSTKSYQQGSLLGITFRQTDMSGWSFARQNLTGCKFSQCKFTGADFEDAVITDVQFANVGFGDCTGLSVEQIRSTWNFRNGRIEGIVLPKELAQAMQRQ